MSRNPPEEPIAGTSIESASLGGLISIWQSHAAGEGVRTPEICRAVGERILAQGEPLLAYDVISDGLTTWPKDVRLRQLQGLALARSGASERANKVLEQLRNEGHRAEETLGMLGRTYKDLAAAARSTSERTRFLKRAAEIYGEAFQQSGGYWTGINAATMTLLVGEEKRAGSLAANVREQCLKAAADPGGDSYWEFAALGEAALICRDYNDAAGWYQKAAKEGKTRFGDLNSSRRNARLILRYWKKEPHWIDKYLVVPGVVVFAGHMIDQPNRAEPRFPASQENFVAQRIREELEKSKPGFGFASAACGSDILFLEAMLERGAEISIVLPYNKQQFIEDSVAIGPSAKKWCDRFDNVMARAARVLVASDQRLEIGGISYEFCNELLLGLATIRCRQLDSTLVPMVVWNRKPGDGPGGAASVVKAWSSSGLKTVIVDLPRIQKERSRQRRKSARKKSARQSFRSRIVAILFADAVGFSKLTEPEVPRFVEYFLGPIARLTKKFGKSMIANNTWGDGLYFVFDDVERAAEFALQLADLITQTKWGAKGLPPELNLRIALHGGPVYEFVDPITRQRTFSGTHVSRAARIEPITPPGQVYASEAFAALAAGKRSHHFSCDYVGQTPMAKGYGTFPVYHLRRRGAVTRL